MYDEAIEVLKKPKDTIISTARHRYWVHKSLTSKTYYKTIYININSE